MDRMESEVLEEKLDDVRKKLAETIAQLQLLENKMRDYNNRFKRAHTNKRHGHRSRIRHRLTTAAGVKLMYRHYLSIKAEEVRVLEQTLSAIGYNNGAEQQPNQAAQVAVGEEGGIDNV